MMKSLIRVIALIIGFGLLPLLAEPMHVEYAGGSGLGHGKHVVLIAGDEEYRSEESMPMLGKILSQHHGFRCKVLFSVSPEGVIDPNAAGSLTNPEALDSADAIVMLIRFRHWPDETMKRFDNAMRRGVPVIALRTSTHAFQFPKESSYAAVYNAFGKQVLGERWVSHWGNHQVEATRGVIEKENAHDPVLRGVMDVFGNSDVYEAAPPADAKILLRGEVLAGMNPTDAPANYVKKTRAGVEQNVNHPMMPVAWTRELNSKTGGTQRIFCTTMGAATDLTNPGLRRLVVNGVFWCLGLEVPAQAEVKIVGDYHALMYGFNQARPHVRPSAHTWDAEISNEKN